MLRAKANVSKISYVIAQRFARGALLTSEQGTESVKLGRWIKGVKNLCGCKGTTFFGHMQIFLQKMLHSAWAAPALSLLRAGRHLLWRCVTRRKYDGRKRANNGAVEDKGSVAPAKG